METKLPSSNWSAEIYTKLFTSADTHTLMGSLRANQCNAPKAICMVSSFHLPILYPQIHPSHFCSIGPFTRVRNLNPRNRTSTLPPKNPTTTYTHIQFFTTNKIKGLKCCFFNNIFISSSYQCMCVYACVYLGGFPSGAAA